MGYDVERIARAAAERLQAPQGRKGAIVDELALDLGVSRPTAYRLITQTCWVKERKRRSDRGRRTYRWLFNALHSLDFHALIAHRPAWDIVVWFLSLLGLVISASGVVIGWRRLTR